VHTGSDLTEELARKLTGAFDHRGYRMISAVPVVEGDETVTFVNATITPHKEWLRSGAPIGKTYQLQQCLRSNGDPPWLYSFLMIGLLADSKFRFEVYRDAAAVLVEHVLLAAVAERVVVLVDKRDVDIQRTWKQAAGPLAARIRIVDGQQWATRWQYGHGDDLTGRGLTVFLEHPYARHGEDCQPGCGCRRWQALGNVIDLQTPTGGYVEAAFGVETLRATAYGGDLYQLPEIQQVVARLAAAGLDQPAARQAVNHVRAIATLIRDGCQPGAKGGRSVLRRMLRWLAEALSEPTVLETVEPRELRRDRLDGLINDRLVTEAVWAEHSRWTAGRERLKRAALAFAMKNPQLSAAELGNIVRHTYGVELTDLGKTLQDHQDNGSNSSGASGDF
jgi:alanyl-tRNA synthetase